MARSFSNVLLVIFWTENDTEDNFFEPEKIERNIWEERQYVISIFNMFVWKQHRCILYINRDRVITFCIICSRDRRGYL